MNDNLGYDLVPPVAAKDANNENNDISNYHKDSEIGGTFARVLDSNH